MFTPAPIQSTQPQQSFNPPPQVLGTNTFGGGGTGLVTGGGSAEPPLESQPSAPSLDFDALIAPGLEALGQAEAAAQAQFGAAEAGIEGARAGAVERAGAARTAGEQAVTKGQTRAESRGEAAVGEQRRGFSEQAQALRARFGTSISTGLGAEAIAGRQALSNISSIRTTLAETIQDLTLRRQAIVDTSESAIREAEANATTLRTNARAGLQQVLSDIGRERGQLQSRKAELVFQAVESFRNTVTEVNQRNTEFKQQLFQQQQAADQKLQAALTRSQSLATNLEEFTLTPGQTRAIPLSNLGTGAAEAFGAEGALPPGVEFSTAGQFGVFRSPEEDESLENRINQLPG